MFILTYLHTHSSFLDVQSVDRYIMQSFFPWRYSWHSAFFCATWEDSNYWLSCWTLDCRDWWDIQSQGFPVFSDAILFLVVCSPFLFLSSNLPTWSYSLFFRSMDSVFISHYCRNVGKCYWYVCLKTGFLALENQLVRSFQERKPFSISSFS